MPLRMGSPSLIDLLALYQFHFQVGKAMRTFMLNKVLRLQQVAMIVAHIKMAITKVAK